MIQILSEVVPNPVSTGSLEDVQESVESVCYKNFSVSGTLFPKYLLLPWKKVWDSLSLWLDPDDYPYVFTPLSLPNAACWKDLSPASISPVLRSEH